MGVVRALYVFLAYFVFATGFVAALVGGFYMAQMRLAYGKTMVWLGSCKGLPANAIPPCRKCQKWSLIFFGAVGAALVLALIGNVTGLAQSS